MGLLDGKKGLILNIANDRSIATHIASAAVRQGATCGFGFLPMDNIEKSQRRVRKAMEECGFPDAWLHPCDVSSDESIEKFFAGAKEQFGDDRFPGALPGLCRSHLPEERPRHLHLHSPRSLQAGLDISAYSLIALTRAALPLMPEGGSVIGLTYLGSEKVIPGYNVMGVAKAALESTARYLAFDLGRKTPRQHPLRRPGQYPQRHGRRRHRRNVHPHGKQGPPPPQHRRRRSRQNCRLPPQRPLQRRHRRKHLCRFGIQYCGVVRATRRPGWAGIHTNHEGTRPDRDAREGGSSFTASV